MLVAVKLAGAAALVMAMTAGEIRADALPAPEGDVVLTISGNIANANSGETAIFDMAMLRELPVAEFSTSTIWTDGIHTFTGVPLTEILDAAGATGATIKATAINDYAVEIPRSSISESAPIVAYEFDGAEMSLRDKGPLWLVYPYDSSDSYQSEDVYSRSIWQLDRLALED